jgi:predicted P-loop ATPase
MMAAKEWTESRIRGKNGPRAILANAITAFLNAPEWVDILWYDAFRQRATLRGKPQWAEKSGPVEEAWTDQHDRLAANWLQREGIHVSPVVAGQAAETVARDRPFHPVINYLVDLTWDRIPRLDTWTIDCLGVEDSQYVRATSPRFMTAAVARVMEPGCKSDCAPILEGPQGILKSTSLRILFSPWFTDDVADLGSKDAAMQISGAWCVELAELDSISRAEVSKIKAFISRQTDRFRPPYGARVIELQRQCVFAGTTNGSEYLRDETGGRRFWPWLCTKVNIAALTKAKDQLWAEARCRYDQGNPWWLDTAELNGTAAAAQAERLVRDPWTETIQDYLPRRDGKKGVSVDELLEHIGIRLQDRDQRAANRVAACLKVLGWRGRQTRVEGKPYPVKRYHPPAFEEQAQ